MNALCVRANVFILMTLVVSGSALVTIYDDDGQPHVFNLAPLSFEKTPANWNLTTEIVTDQANSSMWRGRVVLITNIPAYGWEGEIYQVAAGLVPGYSMFIRYRPTANMLTVPVGEFTQVNHNWIQDLINNSSGKALTINWDSVGDYNLWEETCNSGWFLFWQLSVAAYCVLVFGMAVYKFTYYIRDQGFILSVHHVSLLVIAVGMTWRLLYMINPLMCRRAWPDRIDEVFFTTSAPFSFTSVFLVTLYLHEVLSKRHISINPFVKRLRIPFFIACGFLFIVEIVFTIIRGTVSVEDIGMASSINIFVYIFISVVFLGFFTATIVRLIRRLKFNANRYSNKKTQKVKKVVIFYAVTSFGLVVFLVSSGLLLGDFAQEPYPFTVIWWLMFMGMTTVSFGHTLSYAMAKNPSDSSSSSSKTNSKSKYTRSASLNQVQSNTSTA